MIDDLPSRTYPVSAGVKAIPISAASGLSVSPWPPRGVCGEYAGNMVTSAAGGR